MCALYVTWSILVIPFCRFGGPKEGRVVVVVVVNCKGSLVCLHLHGLCLVCGCLDRLGAWLCLCSRRVRAFTCGCTSIRVRFTLFGGSVENVPTHLDSCLYMFCDCLVYIIRLVSCLYLFPCRCLVLINASIKNIAVCLACVRSYAFIFLVSVQMFLSGSLHVSLSWLMQVYVKSIVCYGFRVIILFRRFDECRLALKWLSLVNVCSPVFKTLSFTVRIGLLQVCSLWFPMSLKLCICFSPSNDNRLLYKVFPALV